MSTTTEAPTIPPTTVTLTTAEIAVLKSMARNEIVYLRHTADVASDLEAIADGHTTNQNGIREFWSAKMRWIVFLVPVPVVDDSHDSHDNNEHDRVRPRYYVQTASAFMPGSCRGMYKRIAVLEIDPSILPEGPASSISVRARGVIRIVETWEKLSVGKTPRSAYQRALREAEALRDSLEIGMGPLPYEVSPEE